MIKNAWFIGLILGAVSGLAGAVNPVVTLQISGGASGKIVLELYKDEAPITVANFIVYVKSGFYDGLIFHRVIENFMIQGGGFDAELNYKQPAGSIINESYNRLSNIRGTLAMARGDHPHSASSQFFINHANNTFLNFGYEVIYDSDHNRPYYLAGYCVFGRVISGMDVVDQIAVVATDANGVPFTPIVIQSATVTVDTLCTEPLEGDINGDCVVNLADLVLLAQDWLVSTAPAAE